MTKHHILIILISLNIMVFVALLTDLILTKYSKTKLDRPPTYSEQDLYKVYPGKATSHFIIDASGKYIVTEIPTTNPDIDVVLRWEYLGE